MGHPEEGHIGYVTPEQFAAGMKDIIVNVQWLTDEGVSRLKARMTGVIVDGNFQVEIVGESDGKR